MKTFYQDTILVAFPIFILILFLNFFTNVAGNVQVSPQILIYVEKKKIFSFKYTFR